MLYKPYKDKGTPEMHGSLLSPVAKYNLLMKKMRDMVSSQEVGNMLLNDFLPHQIVMKLLRFKNKKNKMSFPSQILKNILQW